MRFFHPDCKCLGGRFAHKGTARCKSREHPDVTPPFGPPAQSARPTRSPNPQKLRESQINSLDYPRVVRGAQREIRQYNRGVRSSERRRRAGGHPSGAHTTKELASLQCSVSCSVRFYVFPNLVFPSLLLNQQGTQYISASPVGFISLIRTTSWPRW